MNKYEPKDFISKLNEKLQGRSLICPICGGRKFTVPEQMASIISQGSFDGIQIGQSIPSGIVICENCGHIHFFALGALKLLPNNQEKSKNE